MGIRNFTNLFAHKSIFALVLLLIISSNSYSEELNVGGKTISLTLGEQYKNCSLLPNNIKDAIRNWFKSSSTQDHRELLCAVTVIDTKIPNGWDHKLKDWVFIEHQKAVETINIDDAYFSEICGAMKKMAETENGNKLSRTKEIERSYDLYNKDKGLTSYTSGSDIRYLEPSISKNTCSFTGITKISSEISGAKTDSFSITENYFLNLKNRLIEFSMVTKIEQSPSKNDIDEFKKKAGELAKSLVDQNI